MPRGAKPTFAMMLRSRCCQARTQPGVRLLLHRQLRLKPMHLGHALALEAWSGQAAPAGYAFALTTC